MDGGKQLPQEGAWESFEVLFGVEADMGQTATTQSGFLHPPPLVSFLPPGDFQKSARPTVYKGWLVLQKRMVIISFIPITIRPLTKHYIYTQLLKIIVMI